jgi:hypothetical protein
VNCDLTQYSGSTSTQTDDNETCLKRSILAGLLRWKGGSQARCKGIISRR